MEGIGAKGDPVLIDCRSSVFYNDPSYEIIPYHGNNNRSPAAVLDATVINEFNRNTINENLAKEENELNHNNILFQHPDKEFKEIEEEAELTVSVQNVYKSYIEGKPILSNLCMNVKKGSIYGLLGSSGCGKTTLLTSIVGLQKWDSGQILLFNKMPGQVPGRKIGFMPQEIALYGQLSVREMIGYYGRLYGMTEKDVEKQWLWLVEFLQLPAKFKLIKDLSGGQQRRVSLALTLSHQPDLLILDEPTVGLDPLLRESIWKYLFNMVQTRKTTVIVTTHYIEEARFSNTIGVMRRGRLLVEDSPETLLQLYQCDLLEQVVLKLCRKDQEVNGRGSDISNLSNSPSPQPQAPTSIVISKSKKSVNSIKDRRFSKNRYNVQENMIKEKERVKNSTASSATNEWMTTTKKRFNQEQKADEDLKEKNPSSIFDRTMAFSIVTWMMFMRHPVFMIMILFLPTVQMILTLAVIGTHPKDMRFGVVNDDLPNYSEYCFNSNNNNNINSRDEYNYEVNTNTSTVVLLELNHSSSRSLEENEIEKVPNKRREGTCDFQHFTCTLITELSRTGTLKLIPIPTEQDAVEEVQKGNLWGYYTFGSNYSQHLQDLVTARNFAENETLQGSRVHLTMDMSHYMGAAFAIRESFEAYEKSVAFLANTCGVDPREFALPFEYRKPVFGRTDVSYHDYVIPIVILTVVFEIPMLVTAILFINDRKQGTLNRARVAGLHFKEVMVSNFLTQGSVILGQTGICSLVLYLFYDFRVEGCYALYFFMCVLGGICGESLGLLLGVLFQEEVEALMFGIFLGPILLLLEGVLWPVEGMSPVVRTIARISPTTLIIESLRSVIYRGVDFLHGHVWPGIASMTLWTVAIWIVSIVIFIRRHK